MYSHLNKSIQPMAKRAELFKKAPPALFGAEFAKASKDHVDIMNTAPKRSSQYFLEGPPKSRGARGATTGTTVEVAEAENPAIHNQGRGSKFQRRNYALQNEQGQQRPPQSGKHTEHRHCHTQSKFEKYDCESRGDPDGVPAGRAGRLANLAQNWAMRSQKDKWVLDVVKGYQISFLRAPSQVRIPHPPHYSAEQTKLLT